MVLSNERLQKLNGYLSDLHVMNASYIICTGMWWENNLYVSTSLLKSCINLLRSLMKLQNLLK